MSIYSSKSHQQVINQVLTKFETESETEINKAQKKTNEYNFWEPRKCSNVNYRIENDTEITMMKKELNE